MGRHKENGLTRPQAVIMQEICRHYDLYDQMPTIRDLRSRLQLTDSTIFFHINELVRKGYLSKEPLKARNLDILKRVESDNVVLTQIPILGKIAAGLPIIAEENMDGNIMVDVALTRNSQCFALRVDGSSMINAGIDTGDIVVIRHQPIAQNKDIVAALYNGGVTLKRLVYTPDRIALEAENPLFSPIELTAYDSFQIIGVMLKHFKPNEVIYGEL